MKKPFIIALLAVTFSMSASATDWSELIGKELVLYRWGEFQDNWFSWIRITNPAGERPVERMVLTDDTHLEWKYSLDGDFTRECSIEGEVMTLKEPLFGNNHLRIVECDGEVLLASGEDNLTRAFSILNPKPEPSQLPASVGSKKGFCDGKLNDLLPYITDVTYSSRTPMGRNFLHHRQASLEDKVWLESTKEVFDEAKGQIKAFDVNLFPNGKPVLADVHQKSINDCNAMSVLADMAFLYPEFIKSIIHQEAADSFRVDMFDPMGNPIDVIVDNKMYSQQVTGKNGVFCWTSIMEKALMKWETRFRCNKIGGIGTEHAAPPFTGNGTSYSFNWGDYLYNAEYPLIVDYALSHGMISVGGFHESGVMMGDLESVTGHAFTVMYADEGSDYLFVMRNPWGNEPSGSTASNRTDGKLKIPNDHSKLRLVDFRLVFPGEQMAQYKKENLRGYTPPRFRPMYMDLNPSDEMLRMYNVKDYKPIPVPVGKKLTDFVDE